MKAEKLVGMTNEELVALENELKEKLFSLRFQLATHQLTNPVKITECKKDIARVKTVLSERANKAKG